MDHSTKQADPEHRKCEGYASEVHLSPPYRVNGMAQEREGLGPVAKVKSPIGRGEPQPEKEEGEEAHAAAVSARVMRPPSGDRLP